MGLEMSAESWSVRETVTALYTNIWPLRWPFVRVDPAVLSHSCTRFKRLLTHCTLVWPFVTMNAAMNSKASFVGEALTAHFTGEWPLSGMESKMHNKVLLLGEALTTY